MRTPSALVVRAPSRRCAVVLAPVLVLALCSALRAQIIATERAVGGISIDAHGLLDNAAVDMVGELARQRAAALGQIPGELNQSTELRKVSLRRLEAAIGESLRDNKDLPDEIKYLAGLQQIRYVFVYPQQRDIVLVGPGEAWQVDRRGNLVGVGTGRPVMLLDDLLVALRSARRAANGGISCSIDPTDEGVVQFSNYLSSFRTMGSPQVISAGVERALGQQNITVTGVPETSHFARVLVAADYRMKRLGMNLDQAPVAGLPSYLHMMKAGSRRTPSSLPRWWLEPDYEPLLHSPDRLAWELCGASVKAMTMEDFVAASGAREASGRANRAAQKWADLMTEKYDELALADPIFGQLRNCMELAVVSALIVKEHLAERAGYSMPLLLDPADVKTEQFAAAKHVASRASLLKKGRNWLISASGGVQVNSWNIADNVQPSDAPAQVHAESAAADETAWWWN